MLSISEDWTKNTGIRAVYWYHNMGDFTLTRNVRGMTINIDCKHRKRTFHAR